MQTYKVTLAIRNNANFTYTADTCTGQRAIILATDAAKKKLGPSIKVMAANADLIECKS